MEKRYLEKQVERDLQRKMVFVGGPRQVGKTTLARRLLGALKKNSMAHDGSYLNWDVPAHREAILRGELPVSHFWVFDELHKYKDWRSFLKGIYDIRAPEQRILVTGSARLDYYRHGGESLQGRYHYLRLFPLSLAELSAHSQKDLESLYHLGGFPEPFFGGSKKEALRWSREYRVRLIEEELNQLERVDDLSKVELLSLRLPDLVGSPLSVNSLREELKKSHKTVERWISILERLYALTRIPPFGSPKIRAVKKEQKHFHFDWTVVPETGGARFENLIAIHLLKWVCFQQDSEGRDLELRYFRDIDLREVDFVVTEKGEPLWFIEVKTKDEPVSKALRYLHERFPQASCWQISFQGKKDFQTREGIRVCPARLFLKDLI
jgi:uncharacterized protein